METTVTVKELLQNLLWALPTMYFATQTLTAAIHGMFNITNKNVNHAISWIVAVLCGLGMVACNGLNFGLEPVWNYIVAAIAGVLVTGPAANGYFDWPKMEAFFDLITNLFLKKENKK